MALVETDEKFNQYKQLLSQNNPSAADLMKIEADISAFWLQRHIAIRSLELTQQNDPLIRAMALEPQLNGYLELQNRIRHLQWLAEQDWWQVIVLDHLIRPGESDPIIPIVARRLWLLGDASNAATDSNELSSFIVEALKRFQLRHGLKADAVIGPETLKWLNVTPAQRASILAENYIQRAEFMAQRDDRFLVINIPAFEMELFDHGEVELVSRVIVGKPYRPTPIISSSISNVVINPTWRVPKKIMYNDLLPQVRKDGNYISERNFDVFDRKNNLVVRTAEQWSDLAKGPFPFTFVQRPGVNNTLGRYKFYFPNDFSVYLHDTSDPELFQRSNRALSSGCIRIENVQGLANWMAANLVKDKQTWVDRHADRRRTQWFALNSSLNVHLVYWTAWIDDSNQAQYRNDIYQLQEGT
ncbi:MULTISPECIES: murein L,D-transpeptidase [unclassified Shewanella]|uniref:L,D-transpeptidase family protein n=1 Tax=unclassified Shewanella TaxID=196818 RepID=UPI001BB8170D|nr:MULTISPECIES: L,D-transpeptidase family protein [unclassified Shewanella]GIU19101.1 peptidoglycan-binding protein [Shewanella sp. MBTL60-112-B1]GIU40149.1 peptidoglycan-binding protein [Shewanella sp. MBTL60-112-B2]